MKKIDKGLYRSAIFPKEKTLLDDLNKNINNESYLFLYTKVFIMVDIASSSIKSII